ncbi:ferritin-like domain-containing protein [Tribonema minus]|uniref:Ferritin-like domain-containing protein n=1 Tax=Tribonema minus TaxID=303371 RepID=A0A835ZGC8_9STRA|nr:ferritin-like domain-containing protein [Tribonema minus]
MAKSISNLRGGARELATAAPSAAPSSAPAMMGGPITDTDILNFALNLECLEAEFYSYAAFGAPLTDEQRGGGPASIGGKQAVLSDDFQTYAEEIANHEIGHVELLRGVLGDAAVPCPLMDIGPAFAAAANAAVGMKLAPAYTPYFNDPWFALGAFIFEDVGVTAYNGAAPLIKNKDYLAAAAGLLGVEAYHAGIVRTLLYQVKDTPLTPYPVTVAAATTAVSNLRGMVGGDKDVPIYDGGETHLVPVDENSLVFARTVDEVLAIVYLGDAKKPGGFFPDGINMMM